MVTPETTQDLDLLEISASAAPLPPSRPAPSVFLRRLLFVLAVTACAFLLRLVLSPILGDDSPFLPFILAVMLGSWYGGFRAGLLAVLCSAVPAWYFFVQPYRPAALRDPGYLVQLGLFIIIGITVSAVNEGWHRARRRLSAHEEFLSTILENTPDGVLALDHEGCVTFANHSAAELFGLESGLLVGRPYTEIGLLRMDAQSPELSEVLRSGASCSGLRLMIEDAAASRVEIVAKVTRFPMKSAHCPGLVLSLSPV